MTILTFGNYINSGGQIINKSSIEYTKTANIDADTLHHMGIAAATNPFINGCSRFSENATGIIANGKNDGVDVAYARVIDFYF